MKESKEDGNGSEWDAAEESGVVELQDVIIRLSVDIGRIADSLEKIEKNVEVIG